MSTPADDPVPDPASVPVRVAEVVVAAYQWDEWRRAAEATGSKSRRVAAVAGALVAAALATTGLVLLPSGSTFSVLLYTPLVGVAVWAGTASLLTRRGLAPVVGQVRAVVVPALLDDIAPAALFALLRQGGTLVTEVSTTILEVRRDSVVALVASQYDMSTVQAPPFPSGGGP